MKERGRREQQSQSKDVVIPLLAHDVVVLLVVHTVCGFVIVAPPLYAVVV
jgi:hypothetical protein